MKLLAIAVIAFLIPEASAACSCRPTDLREHFAEASIVFVATVIESRIEGPVNGADVRVRARFRVEEQFKGDASQVTALVGTVTLLAVKDQSQVLNSCSSTQQFAIGSQFLVLAAGPGEVEVAPCTPTRPLAFDRWRALEELRSWR